MQLLQNKREVLEEEQCTHGILMARSEIRICCKHMIPGYMWLIRQVLPNSHPLSDPIPSRQIQELVCKEALQEGETAVLHITW